MPTFTVTMTQEEVERYIAWKKQMDNAPISGNMSRVDCINKIKSLKADIRAVYAEYIKSLDYISIDSLTADISQFHLDTIKKTLKAMGFGTLGQAITSKQQYEWTERTITDSFAKLLSKYGIATSYIGNSSVLFINGVNDIDTDDAPIQVNEKVAVKTEMTKWWIYLNYFNNKECNA